MNAAGATGVRELRILDANLAQQALKLVDVAGRNGGERNIAFALVAWQPHRARRKRVVGAGLHVERDLPPPFPQLNDQRNAHAGRDILQGEGPIRFGDVACQSFVRRQRRAPIAARAIGKRRQLRAEGDVGNENGRIVDGIGVGEGAGVNGPADGGRASLWACGNHRAELTHHAANIGSTRATHLAGRAHSAMKGAPASITHVAAIETAGRVADVADASPPLRLCGADVGCAVTPAHGICGASAAVHLPTAAIADDAAEFPAGALIAHRHRAPSSIGRRAAQMVDTGTPTGEGRWAHSAIDLATAPVTDGAAIGSSGRGAGRRAAPRVGRRAAQIRRTVAAAGEARTAAAPAIDFPAAVVADDAAIASLRSLIAHGWGASTGVGESAAQIRRTTSTAGEAGWAVHPAIDGSWGATLADDAAVLPAGRVAGKAR